MSILAQPRRKQRISVDPQNLSWKNDSEKFGKKVMEKFGWSEGKGLGLKEQGRSDNLKLKANHTAKGLGCENDYDSTWISHHDDFADLLANLNKNKKSSEEKKEEEAPKEEATQSLEETSKSSKARIHYHKFTRGKDLTRFSSKDKSAVIGVGINRKRKHSPEPEPHVEDGEEPTKKAKKEEEEKRDVEADSGFSTKTIVSQVSVHDYFAEKMRKMKERAATAKLAAQQSEAPQPEVTSVEEKEEKAEDEKEETEEERKLRKQKRKEEKRRLKEEARRQAEAEAEAEAQPEPESQPAAEQEEVVEETKEERKRRKREKKLRKLAEAAAAQEAES